MQEILDKLVLIPAIVIGLTIHECAHAFAAWKLGDDTAKSAGRLTLNPLKHIDPFGFLLLLIAGFGWAKPVSFDPTRLKRKYRDEVFIALAGPISNIALAALLFGAARVSYAFADMGAENGLRLTNLLIDWGALNVGLFIFNLLPIPPLDGSHLYLPLLKEQNERLFALFYKYGTYALLAIIVVERQLKMDILPVGNAITNVSKGMLRLFGFPI